MDISWLSSILYGFVSGIAEILPVSAHAHRILMQKFLGVSGSTDLLNLLIHIGVFGAFYYHVQAQLIRMNRARALARIPKKKRNRPLDTKSLMDWSMLKTMLIPVVLGLYLYQHTISMEGNLVFVALFLFLNGIVLYIPQFFPTGNKDSRTLSRIEGILMGMGGGVSIFPGISSVGTALSIGSICGVEKNFNLSMIMLMQMFAIAGFSVYDVLGIAENGFGTLSVLIVLRYLLTAAAAFGGTNLGIRIMKYLTEENGYTLFGIYCWGLSLFTFILNLMA